MAWRIARSLDHLLAQINAAYPNRSKAADGGIGDAAHAASVSDHNPDDAGVVRARDYTHDPANGFDAHALADRLIASRDPRIKYVISRGRIASATVSPWVWRAYSGSNRHDHHVHVSVVADSRADNTADWTITTKPKDWDEMATKDEIRAVVREELNAALADLPSDVWAHPGLVKGRSIWGEVVTGTNRAQSATDGLKALAETLPESAARAVLDALSKDYEANVQLTPKES